MRKGKPMGDGTRLETGRAMSLEGSTPSPSACSRGIGPMARLLASNQAIGVRLPDPALERWLMRPWPSGQARASQVRQAGSTPAGRLGNRLTVGSLTLNQAVEVRILLPESGAVAAGSDAAL